MRVAARRVLGEKGVGEEVVIDYDYNRLILE